MEYWRDSIESPKWKGFERMFLFGTPERAAARAERRRLKEERAAQRARQRIPSHQERLVTAAGISSVNLVCHRDTFVFIQDADVVLRQRVRLPAAGDETLIKVPLSGPNLVRVLTTLRSICNDPFRNSGDQAVATRIYRAVAQIVDTVDRAATSGTPVPDILLDDRVGSVEAVPPTDAA
ncbi:hypothetical protein HD597_000390 [Nonomuraea thailandensis]|uniref:Uncharacterized protein n=1 Tax=Nonomuraea thailandensis TaxID=1188745 RepID=A0A9X2G8V1_9ACTN|nr:hypothetical protein [Nonomuraea thailandensis]MCP2353370.1 hypothetical protein [Nonomuraea thailandensis]